MEVDSWSLGQAYQDVALLGQQRGVEAPARETLVFQLVASWMNTSRAMMYLLKHGDIVRHQRYWHRTIW